MAGSETGGGGHAVVSAAERDFRALVAPWAATWGLPGLDAELSIALSTRLRSTLGRCRPAAGRITLRADLVDGPSERLREVLCHEAAHVAAFRLFGRRARPHGPEWRGLVAAVGFSPRVRAPALVQEAASAEGPDSKRLDGGRAPAENRPTRSYEHRCPVCHTARFARRPVLRWRCAECLDAGLEGGLLITRRS